MEGTVLRSRRRAHPQLCAVTCSALLLQGRDLCVGRRAGAVGSRITAWESMALLHPAVYAPPNEQVSGVFRPSVVVLTLSLPLSGSHQLPVDINCKQT